MKIIISGGSGLVATELTINLMKYTDYSICLLSRNPISLIERYKDNADRVQCLHNDMLDEIPVEENVIIVHTAFARNSQGEAIAESLRFTQKIASWSKRIWALAFINISSQSIYGDDYNPGIKEDGICNPSYLYAMGKYASEIICQSVLERTRTRSITIRLSSVCENARFIRVFIQNALQGKPINLTAPDQTVSFIDVRDVADALLSVIKNITIAEGCYNLGSGKWYSIKTVAEKIALIGESNYGIDNVTVNINDSGKRTQSGMSIEKFSTTFGWNPKRSIESMIESIYNMLTNVNGGGMSNFI